MKCYEDPEKHTPNMKYFYFLWSFAQLDYQKISFFFPPNFFLLFYLFLLLFSKTVSISCQSSLLLAFIFRFLFYLTFFCFICLIACFKNIDNMQIGHPSKIFSILTVIFFLLKYLNTQYNVFQREREQRKYLM